MNTLYHKFKSLHIKSRQLPTGNFLSEYDFILQISHLYYITNSPIKEPNRGRGLGEKLFCHIRRMMNRGLAIFFGLIISIS